MLKLSSVLRGGMPAVLKSSDAYERYLVLHARQYPGGIPMSAEEFERYSLGSDWLANLKNTAKKVVQTCRLMVGIHDYEFYLQHMTDKHPGLPPLSREMFYRYCLESRYPSSDRPAGSKCPC